jgi:hypothetical protein
MHYNIKVNNTKLILLNGYLQYCMFVESDDNIMFHQNNLISI